MRTWLEEKNVFFGSFLSYLCCISVDSLQVRTQISFGVFPVISSSIAPTNSNYLINSYLCRSHLVLLGYCIDLGVLQ